MCKASPSTTLSAAQVCVAMRYCGGAVRCPDDAKLKVRTERNVGYDFYGPRRAAIRNASKITCQSWLEIWLLFLFSVTKEVIHFQIMIFSSIFHFWYEIIEVCSIDEWRNTIHNVWKLLNISHLISLILAFFTNFCPIKVACLVTLFDRKLKIFKNSLSWLFLAFLIDFCLLRL